MAMNVFTPQDMRFNPPAFEAATVAEKVADEYGLSGEWAPLVGERDQNFRLSAEDGRKFVVKIAGPDEDPDLADFQVRALLFLEKGSPQIPVPRIIRTKTGRCLNELVNERGVKHVFRVVTYLDGIPYGEGTFPDAENLQKIGTFQAQAVSAHLWAEAAADARKLAAPLLHRLRQEVLSELNAGPSQIIHNDAHPYNLLRENAASQDVIGLIDFGDMVHTPVINELAVTAHDLAE